MHHPEQFQTKSSITSNRISTMEQNGRFIIPKAQIRYIVEDTQHYQPLLSNPDISDLERSRHPHIIRPSHLQRKPHNQESSPSSSNTDPPQRNVVGIFSRSSSDDYSWLVEILKSKNFGETIREVRPCYISNNGFQQFMNDLSQCTFGILYHTKNRGRVNITNVNDSLYDEELENLNKILGKDNVLVVIDDLEDNSDQEKTRILENQPSIGMLASDFLLISQKQKADKRQLERILKSIKKFCHPSGYPPPLSNIDPSDQDRSGHTSISSSTHAQRVPPNRGYPQPLSNIDPSDQYRSGHPPISSPTHAQREPYNKGYPKPLSNIDPSGQYRSGHPPISSPTYAQREPPNRGNFSNQSLQDQRPKVLNETLAPTKPTIAVFSISEEGHILWLRRLLSSDIFGHQDVTFHSISLDDKGELRAEEFQCKVAVLYHTMQSGEFPHRESLYHKVLQQMSEKLGRGNVVMIIDDVQAKEMLGLKKMSSDIERLAEDLCPISPKDKEDETKLVQKLKKVQQFRQMSEHPHKVDLAPQTSKTLNTCSQKTPTSRRFIIGIFSVSEEGHIGWLRRLMSSDTFGQREVTYHKMPSYDNVGLEEGKLQCGVAILYHTMKTGKVVTSQGEFLYHKVTDQLAQKLGKDKVIVLIDDLKKYTDKKWAVFIQSKIERWAGDFLYFLEEEKHNQQLLIQRLKSLKLFCQPPDPVQPASGECNTISAPASSVIGVFSCSEMFKFSWLDRLLSSEEFGNHQVRFHQIIPGNMSGFQSSVPHCKFGILYHSMDRGYKPITDMENSLYDEELKYLSTTLGKSRVIVVMDELGNCDEEAKSWTLENQPSLGMLARDVLLFSKQKNKHQEKPNRSVHVDRNLGMFYEKLNTLKEILKE